MCVIKAKRIGENFSASPIWIDGKLYGISDDGEVIELKADDSLEELARNQLDEPAGRRPPSLAGGAFWERRANCCLLAAGRKCLVESDLSHVSLFGQGNG